MRSIFYSTNECVDMDTTRTLLQAAGKGRRINSLEIYCLQLFKQKMKPLMNKLRKMNPPLRFHLWCITQPRMRVILKPSLPSWPCLTSEQRVLSCNSQHDTCFRYISHWLAFYLPVVLACNYFVSINILQNVLLSHILIITG